MAELKETAEWVEGIYQLEVTDPVEGGENGIDNLQAKQLANRTLFLKQEMARQDDVIQAHQETLDEVVHHETGLQTKAPIVSPNLTGVPTAPTASGNDEQQIVNVAYLSEVLSSALFQFAQNNPDSVEQIRDFVQAKGVDEKYAILSGLLNALSERLSVFHTSEAEMWLAQAITDKNGQIAYGVTHRGDFYQPAATHINSDFFGWAMTDRSGRLLFGFNAPSGEMLLPNGKVGLNPQTAYALTDRSGRAAMHVRANGAVHFSGGVADDTGMVYLQSGDVFHQKGGVITQMTHRGDVVACQSYGRAIRFVAPRRGVNLTYEMAENGTIKQVFSDSSTDGYIITGQSLAEGGANVAVSKQPVAIGRAYMIDTGPIPNAARTAGVRPVPLKEQVFETIASAFARSDLLHHDKKIMILGAAQGGQLYANLKKGGSTGVYEKIIKQIRVMLNCPFKPTYKAILAIHGEADGNTSNAQYDKNLIEWLGQFTRDIKTLTGQQEQPVLLTCQTSSAAGYKRTAATRHQFTSPFLQLKVSGEHPRIFLVCPKYQFSYKDYAHILAKDTQWLGDYYAKVKKIVVDEGRDWLGLRPKSLTKTDNRTFEIEFHVPVAPLVFDEELVINPNHYGFHLYNAGAVGIASVVLLPEQNKVRITATDDIPQGATVTYAFDNGVGGKSGRTEGARGNLRDSDPAMSSDGEFNLYNWAFAFELPIHQE